MLVVGGLIKQSSTHTPIGILLRSSPAAIIIHSAFFTTVAFIGECFDEVMRQIDRGQRWREMREQIELGQTVVADIQYHQARG